MRLLLDANVLVLLIVGKLRPSLIGQHQRLQEYEAIDFEIVNSLAIKCDTHISTPHVLAETSNLLGSGKQTIVEGGTSALRDYIAVLDEIYVPAKDIIATEEMDHLGLADAGIHYLADQKIKVISMDFHLCNRLHEKGVAAINPRNYR